MPPLRVIAAAVLGSRGLLLVSKRAAPDVFYLPGGKPEPGEAPLACLERELEEELGVAIGAAELFTEVRAPAALEGVEMWMTVFLTRLAGVSGAGGRDRGRALVARRGGPRPGSGRARLRDPAPAPRRPAPSVRNRLAPG